MRKDLIVYGKLATLKLGYVAGQVEVTSVCFQRCAHCSNRADAHAQSYGEWSLEQFKELCCSLGKLPTFENLTLTGGDPQAWSPLDDFLDDYLEDKFVGERVFELQINTALSRKVDRPRVWREAFAAVRVSLDAASPATYERTRGVRRDPREILNWVYELAHPNASLIFTATEANLREFPDLVRMAVPLRDARRLRKVMIIPAIGVERTPEFWRLWDEAFDAVAPLGSFTSMDESQMVAHRVFPHDARCWAGCLGFHIKPNGDLYPCCLVGGEAVPTDTRFRIGNVRKMTLEQCLQAWDPPAAYQQPDWPCREICQFKQYTLNTAGELAAQTRLRLP